MKRSVIFFAVALYILAFALAQPAAPQAANEEEFNQINNLINNNSPIGSDGKLNASALDTFKSKAEVRIDEVNQWLTDNFFWLRIVFGMGPEISWLFAIVIWVWLLLFVTFVLNGNQNLTGKSYGWIIGLLIFGVFILTRAAYYLAAMLHWIFDLVINVVIPWGALAVVIYFIIIGPIAVWVWPLAYRALTSFVRLISGTKTSEAIDTTTKTAFRAHINAMKTK